MVMVFLGIVLALAIFPPQFFSSLVGKPDDNEIAEQLAAVRAEQDRLVQEVEKLRGEQACLMQEVENLRTEQARLIQEWKTLQAEHIRFDEKLTRLQGEKASLAEREQKVRGFLRWSLVATFVSGLMAVPAVLVLVALKRQGRRMPDKEVRRVQAPWSRQREQVAQRGGLSAVASFPTYGDNGRNRESVAQRA